MALSKTEIEIRPGLKQFTITGFAEVATSTTGDEESISLSDEPCIVKGIAIGLCESDDFDIVLGNDGVNFAGHAGDGIENAIFLKEHAVYGLPLAEVNDIAGGWLIDGTLHARLKNNSATINISSASTMIVWAEV